MVRIRLRRMGKKHQPTYRIVVADAHSPRDGKFIEIIGNYAPTRQPKVLNVDGERARYWLGVGAQPTETVQYLLQKAGVDAVPGTPYLPGNTDPYVQQAFRQARFVMLKDRTTYGEIIGFKGVYANAPTREACRRQLAQVLSGWVRLRRELNLPLPVLSGFSADNLNAASSVNPSLSPT